MLTCRYEATHIRYSYCTLQNYLHLVEIGVHLAELTVDPNGALAIRQLASVLLKQYVEAHWSQHSEKFRPPETTPAVSDIPFSYAEQILIYSQL